jgi:O-acetyl-ADP-ribose deacetylase (regulator of RNase III)
MITYVLGDLFTSPADVLVNTVNTVGVMGKGIAKDFKKAFPEMFREYQDLCERGELQIGSLHYWRGPSKSVLNFPTKRHWRGRSRLDDIERGLQTFVSRYDEYSINSIAFPQLGCGNGDLDWENQVRPLMEQYLRVLPIEIFLHHYDLGRQFANHGDDDTPNTATQTHAVPFSFDRVWNDLMDIARKNLAGEGMGGWNVTVKNEVDSSSLMFNKGQARFEVTIDEVRDVWQQLGEYGFVGTQEFAQYADVQPSPLIDLMLRLNYIEPARFSRQSPGPDQSSYELLLNPENVGVRLATPSTSSYSSPVATQAALV